MPMVEVSIGELLDKVSILEIKLQYIEDSEQRNWIAYELSTLEPQSSVYLATDSILRQYVTLKSVNLEMWHAMEAVYRWEHDKDTEYMHLIEQIIEVNKRRAEVKANIDSIGGSTIREAKSFMQGK